MEGINDYLSSISHNTAKKEKASDINSLSQSDFLALLSAELKFQDPTKPVDNKDMASQMSQYSTVKGINAINDNISKLTDIMASSQTLQASTLVGREVFVSGDVFKKDNSAEVLFDMPSEGKYEAIFTSKDGKVIGKYDGYAKEGEVSLPLNQDFLKDGDVYSVKVSYKDNQLNKIYDLDTTVKDKVNSVSMMGSNGITLNLEGYGSVDESKIKKIQ